MGPRHGVSEMRGMKKNSAQVQRTNQDLNGAPNDSCTARLETMRPHLAQIRKILTSFALFATLAGVVSLPMAAGASTLRASRTSRASLAAYPHYFPEIGGTLNLRVRVSHESSCSLSSQPFVDAINVAQPCRKFRGPQLFTIAPNLSNTPLVFEVVLLARSGHGSITKAITITQAALPLAVDHYSAVPSWGMYGNTGSDGIGDCSLATVGELLQAFDALNGQNAGPLPDQPFIDTYNLLHGNSTTPGLSVSLVLNYWQSTGIDGNVITSSTQLDPSPGTAMPSQWTIESAVAQYGAVYATFTIPSADAAIAYPDTNVMWTTNEAPAGSPVYGYHAAAIVGYDTNGPYIATWGYVQQVSWAWWNVWGGYSYGVVSNPSWIPNPLSQ